MNTTSTSSIYKAAAAARKAAKAAAKAAPGIAIRAAKAAKAAAIEAEREATKVAAIEAARAAAAIATATRFEVYCYLTVASIKGNAATAAVMGSTTLVVAAAFAVAVLKVRRPRKATRAARKAAARKVMGIASRKANRPSNRPSRATVSTSSAFVRKVHRNSMAVKRAARMGALAVYQYVAIATAVAAPVLANTSTSEVEAILERPKRTAKVMPLALVRPNVRAVRHYIAVAVAVAVAVEVEVEPTTAFSRTEKAEADKAKASLKGSRTKAQDDAIEAKAKRKAEAKAKKAAKSTSTPKTKTDKKDKGKGITSERKGAHNLVVAGPTADNYGWVEISNEELLLSLESSDSHTAVGQAAETIHKDNNDMTTNFSPEVITKNLECLLAGVITPAEAFLLAQHQTVAATTVVDGSVVCMKAPATPATLAPVTNVELAYTSEGRFYPAKALTKEYFAIPADFYAMESIRIAYKSMKLDTHTYNFYDEGGTVSIKTNKHNNSIFINNSHPRIYLVDGVEYHFNNLLEAVFNESISATNAGVLEQWADFNIEVTGVAEDLGCDLEEATTLVVAAGFVKPAQPIHYIVPIAERVETKEKGKFEYKLNEKAIIESAALWEEQGYEVLVIKSELVVSNLSVENFRYNGCIPCEPITNRELERLVLSEVVQKWSADNIHLSVKPISNLSEWLDKVMNSNTGSVKSISFSFNNITNIQQRISDVKGFSHEFTFATPKDHYDALGLEEGSVPAFTINLWTSAPAKSAVVSQKVMADVLTNVPKLERRTGTQGSSLSVRGLFAQNAGRNNVKPDAPRQSLAHKVLATNVVASTTSASVTNEVITPTVAEAKEATASAVVIDTVSGGAAFEVDSVGGALDTAPVINAGDVLKPAASSKQSATPVVATTLKDVDSQLLALTGSSSDDEEEEIDLDDMDLCQAVELKEVKFTPSYDGDIKTIINDLDLAITTIPAGGDYGNYLNDVISISEELSGDEATQVLVHELMHVVISNVSEDAANSFITDWLDTVGQSSICPADMSMEEQFCYSFMEYEHNVDDLSAFLDGVFNRDDSWVDAYNALAVAAGPEVAAKSTAHLSIIAEGTAPVVPALSPMKAALLAVNDQEIIIVTNNKGTVPVAYTDAFPELLDVMPRTLEYGSTTTVTAACGVTLHAICAVSETGTLHTDSLKSGLMHIATLGCDKKYVCEPDLGFGDDIIIKPYILGAVTTLLGQAKVRTLQLPVMGRLVKAWANAGAVVTYPKADLSLWAADLCRGTALTATAVGTGEVLMAQRTPSGRSMVATMAIIKEDGTVDKAALAVGLTELEEGIANGLVPLPITVYSNQQVAFNTIKYQHSNAIRGVEVVDYEQNVFPEAVKIGVLTKGPKGEVGADLYKWYSFLRDGISGGAGLYNVQELSVELFTEAFKAVGLPVNLAGFALCPMPLRFLKNGMVFVRNGKTAKGVVENATKFEDMIDKTLLGVLLDSGVKVYTAQYAWDAAAKKSMIRGVVENIYDYEQGYGLEPLPEGIAGQDMLKLKEDNEFMYPIIALGTIGHSLDQYMQKHVHDTLQYLVDNFGVGVAIRYTQALLPELMQKEGVMTTDGTLQYRLSVFSLQNAAEYYMEFTPVEGLNDTDPNWLSPRDCTIISRRQYDVNAITNLSGFPDTMYDGTVVALALAISAACGRKVTQDAFEGYLAGTTNLWARSENYGKKGITEKFANYSLTSTLKVIIDNSGKTISSTPNHVIDASGVRLSKETGAGRWPYHMPCNAPLDLSVMQCLMKKGQLVICDKYAMERIVVGDGARAMMASILTVEQASELAGYNQNYGLSMALDPNNGNCVMSVCWPTDKASKALNRPWQFNGASQADGWHEKLSWCPLHTDLGNNKRSAIEGFKRTFIATNDFMSHGSGTAQQHPDASLWSLFVPGSMSATLTWNQVPAVQEKVDANGNHLKGLRCNTAIMGPVSGEGPAGKDADGKEVPVSKWFCDTFAKMFVENAIKKAMFEADGTTPRVYAPGEEMVVILDKLMVKGNEVVGYYPNGQTPGLPSSRTVLFTNDLGKQDCVITGYRLLPQQRGEKLQIRLDYATVMDTNNIDTSMYSGMKGRGLGIKFIINHDGTIEYIGKVLYNGEMVDANELYKRGAIHVTPEGLKGNYAFIQGFASAHGNAVMSGPYLTIDSTMPDGTPNPHYLLGSADMVSDMSDSNAYFYKWMKSITQTNRMRKTVNRDVWEEIVAYNREALGPDGKLPGLVIIPQPGPYAIEWDGEVDGQPHVTTPNVVTVEYDVQIAVFDYWVQVEVATPGACTGDQGATSEQAVHIEVMREATATHLWKSSAKQRKGVNSAVRSAEVHANVEAGIQEDGLFQFNPLDKTHQELMMHLLNQVSSTGVRTERKPEHFFILLATLFGGAAMNPTALWLNMLAGKVSNLDYVEGAKGMEVVTNSGGYNYLTEVTGLLELVMNTLGVFPLEELGLTLRDLQELVSIAIQDHLTMDVAGTRTVVESITGVTMSTSATALGIQMYIMDLIGLGYTVVKQVEGKPEPDLAIIPLHVGQGLVINTTSENTEAGESQEAVTYVDPTVFLQLGAFEVSRIAADPKTHAPARTVTGAATGVVNDIHHAFVEWTTTQFWQRNGSGTRPHSMNCRLRASMAGWIGVNSKKSTQLNAKGVLSRVARINKGGVAGKIDTGLGPELGHHIVTDKNGTPVGKLPVAIIHPDCLLAKGLKHGDLIAVGRTPTVSLIMAVVRFSRVFGRMGYIRMSFSVWAAGNNGDSDGDPCNRIRMGGATDKGWSGLTYRGAMKINKSALGMGGYSIVCGVPLHQHDCAEFVSFTNSWTKKVFNDALIPDSIKAWLAVKGLKVKGLETLVNLMLPASLLDSARKVSQHYRANVGVAYGWCSAYSAHMKEKHSYLKAVLNAVLKSEAALACGHELPSIDTLMEVLMSGEIYEAIRLTAVDTVVDGTVMTTITQDAEAVVRIRIKYPAIMALYDLKLIAEVNPMDIVSLGQHVNVMTQASAWLWRGVYEGLGLSGYSPDAFTFFEAFTYALRNKGLVGDASIVDDKGNVTSIAVAKPNVIGGVTIGMTLGAFLSKHYKMTLEIANEVMAACLLYNGYRAIERGQHVPSEAVYDKVPPTMLDTYENLYYDNMSGWPDTKETEYIDHAVLAGVFRRAGQGTTGVSFDDEMDGESSSQMIYTYAAELWAIAIASGRSPFLNVMLNDIVYQSVSLYCKLVQIASIESTNEAY